MADHSTDQHELIDDYLLGNLSGDKLAACEKRLREDDEFAGKVRLHKLIMQEMAENEDDKIRDIISNADKEMDDPVIRHIPYLMYFSYAAAVLVFIALGVYLIFFYQPLPQKLFTEYFVPYDNDLIASPRSSEIPEQFSHFSEKAYDQILIGMKYYEKGDFEKASEILDNKLFNKTRDPELVFYLALSQLACGKTGEAIGNLESLSEHPDHLYRDEVTWYLALAYLNSGEENRTKELLQKISGTKNPYAQQAKELLKKLK